ncbi:leucine-rich repeat domain-containing protein [Candidatus Poribacteria bacterium]
MFISNWLNWAVEYQNWFFGAVGAALIVYMGRGCVSIISKQRRQHIGQIEERGEAGEDFADTVIPTWLAYILLILSTVIPSVIIIVVIIVHIIRATADYGIESALLEIETIAFIIFVATGFLLGLVLWGIMRVIMWVAIGWFARLLYREQPRQDEPRRKGEGPRSVYNLLTDALRKGLFPDRRIEMAIREAIGKHKGRILESDLEGLTRLDANRRKVIDLSGIEHCTNLQGLYIYDNQLRDINPLSSLTNLRELVLTDGGIGKIGSLSNLTKLQRLRMGSNFIADIRPLSKLTNLQELYLRSNEISSIAPLSNLINLQELQLGSNQIKSVTPLKSLINLQELVLADNWINDITALGNLTNLQKLNLGRNQIRNISPLVNNSGMGEGVMIDLTDNPLNDEAYSIHIPALQERGIIVQFSPKP